jgi:uncharacterized protein with HEPN domain
MLKRIYRSLRMIPEFRHEKITGICNKLIHDYFDVNMISEWPAIKMNVGLKKELLTINPDSIDFN